MHTLLHNKVSLWLLGGFLALSFLVLFESPAVVDIDQAVLDYMLDSRSLRLDELLLQATNLAGFFGFLTLITGMTIWLLTQRAYKWLALLWAVSIANVLLVDALKWLFARARPEQAVQLASESSLSYPSGHTMTAIVVFGYTAYLVHLYLRTSRAQAVLMLVWCLFVLVISWSRLYLGVHHFSDVLASWLLGGAILFSLTHPEQSRKLS